MIFIDYNDKRPIYEQIIDRFQTLIINGALEPNTQLPSVRSLAIELSINSNTIQRAYSELEREGYIYSVKGRGSYVHYDKSLVEKQHNKLIHDFESQVALCRSFGIPKEELLQSLNNLYTEVKKNDQN